MTKRILNTWVYQLTGFILLLYLYSCAAFSDPEEFRGMNDEFRDKFFTDLIVFHDYGTSQPRLDLSVEIPVDNISFRKNYSQNTYLSKLVISVNIKDAGGITVASGSYKESSDYTDTELKSKLKGSEYYFYHFRLNPGKYTAGIEINDEFREEKYNKLYDFTVKDNLAEEISLSDIMLLSALETKPDGTKEITPLINGNLAGLKELSVFFEIYNNTEYETAKEYLMKVKKSGGNILKEQSLTYKLLPGKNRMFENVFSQEELKRLFPKDEQPGMRDNSGRKGLSFTLEILDKPSGRVAAQKKLIFKPEGPPPEMMRRPPKQQ